MRNARETEGVGGHALRQQRKGEDKRHRGKESIMDTPYVPPQSPGGRDIHLYNIGAHPRSRGGASENTGEKAGTPL